MSPAPEPTDHAAVARQQVEKVRDLWSEFATLSELATREARATLETHHGEYRTLSLLASEYDRAASFLDDAAEILEELADSLDASKWRTTGQVNTGTNPESREWEHEPTGVRIWLPDGSAPDAVDSARAQQEASEA